ncbi:hypothetical protein BQ8420_09285 [Nocardiopsis sp. JB363]|nr:hypothetical protein BQ8420_09285 [Nocardiopsis sp. JB363]
MAEIEAGDVQARVHELPEGLRARGGGAKGRNDLCSTCHMYHFRASGGWSGLNQVANGRMRGGAGANLITLGDRIRGVFGCSEGVVGLFGGFPRVVGLWAFRRRWRVGRGVRTWRGGGGSGGRGDGLGGGAAGAVGVGRGEADTMRAVGRGGVVGAHGGRVESGPGGVGRGPAASSAALVSVAGYYSPRVRFSPEVNRARIDGALERAGRRSDAAEPGRMLGRLWAELRSRLTRTSWVRCVW